LKSDDRSSPHQRLFFAFLKYCFESWPEEADFLPDNERHLRAWLLVKCNYRTPSMVYEFKNTREMNAVMPFVNAKITHDQRLGIYTWVVEVNGGIALLQPKSMAWDSMGQAEFHKASSDITQFIYDYAKIDFTLWQEMEGRRAA
jgi:hypothetical protein